MTVDRLMTLQEVSERLGVPVGTLYQWRSRGAGLRGIKLGRHVRVRESELERFLVANTDQPQPAA